MNREIKFRAWNKKDNQMINWNDLIANAWNTFRGDIPLSLIYEILVARKEDFEVMQFTGLKDKNDQEIYEGDVVYFEYNLIGKVKVIFNDGKYNICNYLMSKSTVIGNIYENPELL